MMGDLRPRSFICRVCGKPGVTLCRTKSETHQGECSKEIVRQRSEEYYERKRKEKAQRHG